MHVRKRGSKWQVTVKKKGYSPEIKTFKSQAAAKAWGRSTESQMDNGSWVTVDGSLSTNVDALVDNLISHYARFDQEFESSKLGQLNHIRSWFEGVSIHDISYEDVLNFAAHRRKTVAASTLNAQMYYFKQLVDVSRIQLREPVIDQAIKELSRMKLIMGSARRERRLEKGEYEALVSEGKGHWIVPVMDIAITSAMRQGEIHALCRSNINWDRGLVSVWRKDKEAEGGKSLQKIPILDRMREPLLRAQDYYGQGDRLFSVKHAASISDKFAKMTKALGIKDLRFHDFRHEAISRMFEDGMRVEEVRLVSGHRTIDQLMRYVNLRPVDLVGR